MELNPHADFMFGDWLTRQGLDAKGQYAYMKSGWLNRISKGGVRLERHHAQTAPCHICLQQPVVEAMYRWCLYRPRTAWLFPLSVIGQTASLSIYRKNKQASLVDAVSRLGHDGEVYDYFFSGG